MHTSSATVNAAGDTRVSPERTFVPGQGRIMWTRIRLYRLSGFGWLHALRAATYPKARQVTLTTFAPR
jgi:hypothetical protein